MDPAKVLEYLPESRCVTINFSDMYFIVRNDPKMLMCYLYLLEPFVCCTENLDKLYDWKKKIKEYFVDFTDTVNNFCRMPQVISNGVDVYWKKMLFTNGIKLELIHTIITCLINVIKNDLFHKINDINLMIEIMIQTANSDMEQYPLNYNNDREKTNYSINVLNNYMFELVDNKKVEYTVQLNAVMCEDCAKIVLGYEYCTLEVDMF